MTIETLPLTSLGAAAAAALERIQPDKQTSAFAPGVYFGLDEDLYHGSEALGSSDIRRLARDPRAFWWESRFNPFRDEDESEKDDEAKMVGRAMHAAVLEGREALEARFAPTYYKGSVKAGIEERKAILAAGKTPIKAKAWRRIILASSIIRGDQSVGAAFQNTIGTEVSVFWVCPRSGIKKKARFDAVKMRALIDLKSITNRDDIPFEELCHRHIGSYAYFTQAAHYLDAWAALPALLDADAVFRSPSDETLARLRAAAANPITAFVFVFLQKAGAPLVYGTTISPGNGILGNGRADLERAENNWREYFEQFGGTQQPWIRSRPLAELDINDIPSWAFRRY